MTTRSVAWALLATLLAVVAALIVIAIVFGLRISPDLTYGDLLVGLGTIALAAITAVLADATFGVDKKAANREAKRVQNERRAAALLILAELAVVTSTLEKCRLSKSWLRGDLIPCSGWDAYARELVSGISADDERITLVKFFSDLRALEAAVIRGLDTRNLDAVGIEGLRMPGLAGPERVETLIGNAEQVRLILDGVLAG